MKTFNLKTTLATLSLVAGISALFAPAASAYTVYSLAKDYYAIVCADGQIFSYSGGAGGIGIVGPALCEGHGGMAGGNGGGPTAAPATAELKRSMQNCARGGKKIDAVTTKCRTKIRVNRIDMSSSRANPRDAASGLATGKR
ncbi:MAG: hypothetical protein COA42_17810 [Alteromonadaceae bacterium]|nr:MAG: hypothetical protein COA42_17810 [Alteromonadaceae bacterium]